MRQLAVAAVVIGATVALAGAALAAPRADEQRHASGIALLPPLDLTPFLRERDRLGPAFEPIAVAFSDARALAETHPDLLGIPWMDLAHQTLVVRVTGAEGERLARDWMAHGAVYSTAKPGPTLRPTSVPVRFEVTDRSFGRLLQIQNDAIGRGALGFEGESRIWMDVIDEATQRVILETDRVVDPFLYLLAKTYGTEIVAVRVDPHAGPFTSISAAASGSADIERQLAAVMALSSLGALPPLAWIIRSWRRRRVTVGRPGTG